MGDPREGTAVEHERCPQCGRTTVVEGAVVTDADSLYNHVYFVPQDRRVSLGGKPGVKPLGVFRACASCGYFWNRVDPGQLREYIRTSCGELAHQHLECLDKGIAYGLPDTDLAREIAEKVAEIDALVRRGKPHAGRYREIRGVKWDQAIKETRNWRDLKREEKLALFGWESKKKEPRDEYF